MRRRMGKTDKEQVAREEEARRQGQFEGEVKTKLNNIDYKVDDLIKTVNNQSASIDGRVRKAEELLVQHGEIFKESTKTHDEMDKRISSNSEQIGGLVKYQSVQRGIMIVLGVLSTIISPVLTALIINYLLK